MIFGFGIELNKSRVEEMRDSLQTNLDTGATTQTILSENFPLRDFPISSITEYGFYINDQVALGNSGVSIIPAIRFDRYQLKPEPDAIYLEDNPTTQVVSVDESHWSPKLGMLFEFTRNTQFYFQYAEGFRAPPFEDANIGLDIPLFNIRAIPNPDLRSEQSKGYELGFKWNGQRHLWDVTAFYNDYDDFIQTKVNLGFDPVSGRVLFQSQNLDKATIYGSEISYQYRMSNDFKFFSRGVWSKGEDKVSRQPLNDVEPHQLLMGIEWQSGYWSGSFNGSYTAGKSQLDEPQGQTLFRTPSYSLFDAFLHYQLAEQTTISLGLYNLTDRKYWHWSAVKGLQSDDPLIGLLSAPGRQGALQVSIRW